MLEITSKAQLDEIIASGKQIIVDCFATWCGPCRVIGNVLEELEKEYADKVTFVKCNVEDNEEVAEAYLIKNIPTLLFIKDEEVVEKTTGAIPKNKLMAKINEVFS